jgi:hypothetical protein
VDIRRECCPSWISKSSAIPGRRGHGGPGGRPDRAVAPLARTAKSGSRALPLPEAASQWVPMFRLRTFVQREREREMLRRSSVHKVSKHSNADNNYAAEGGIGYASNSIILFGP